ncbi:LmbE-like protein [Roridomyces roridus]|uniref:N-acetylglucosaminylphosphatidylinositol deacetylase n=1 Tax=Roridomyces roridus TaxID=1738132 RepID=A0AAD7BHP1_9AGAR|nr:LmbE-like protein [Roridomyces roridus]
MLSSINPVYAVLVALLFNFIRHPAQSDNTLSRKLAPSNGFTGNVLLLTAHPDDECMFFAPTILALAAREQPSDKRQKDKSSLYSLCLSTGDADGLGAIRPNELEKSLDILNIDSTKRKIIDHPDLQDNFTAAWDAQIIADVVQPFVVENHIDTILTFDRHGISGHPNHKSLPLGVKELIPQVRLYTLISTPPVQKYVGIFAPILAKIDLHFNRLLHSLEIQLERVLVALDISVSSPTPDTERREPVPVFVAGIREYWLAVQAMRAHSSQLVWFRWLYVGFSRYMWVNEWVEVVV